MKIYLKIMGQMVITGAMLWWGAGCQSSGISQSESNNRAGQERQQLSEGHQTEESNRVGPNVNSAVTKVAVHPTHLCVLTDQYEVMCWGNDSVGQSSPPDQEFVDIAAGYGFSCGITKDDQDVLCWGMDSVRIQRRDLRTGNQDLELGDDELEELVISGPPEGEFEELFVISELMCVQDAEKNVECWGRNNNLQTEVPNHSFRSIALSRVGGCGINTQEYTLTCWGGKDWDTNEVRHGYLADPPETEFTSIGLGFNFGCGVTMSGLIECWGDGQPSRAMMDWGGGPEENTFEDPTDPPSGGNFYDIAVGDWHACALTQDGQVLCWGDNSEFQLEHPSIQFDEIFAVHQYTCGVDMNGRVHCWGGGYFNEEWFE